MRSKSAVLLLAVLVAAFVAAGTSEAGIGVNDDSAKYAEDGGAWFFGEAKRLGLRQVVISNRFRPTEPDRIQEEELLDHTLAEAERAGVEVVLAVYPYPPREFEFGGVDLDAFGRHLERLARRYPQVHQYVIGNEPNQPAFWRPVFGPGGVAASVASAGALLAWSYDTLKAVDPSLRVIGLGVSPRGNDDPLAPSNASISPVRFIQALGQWYRASGRTEPLMDGLSFHPYPRSATDPLERGYDWPNAGFVNVDRIKQALWDAFHGTPQPTTVDGLRLNLDELGWQVDTRFGEGYTGRENVPVTTEERQAAIYADVVRSAACDPAIATVNVFGLDDDHERGSGWQAGLYRADRSPRPAAGAIAEAIARTEEFGCTGDVAMWLPAQRVVGAWAGQPRLRTAGDVSVRLVAGESARALACVVAAESVSASGLGRRLQQLSSEPRRCRSLVVTPNGVEARLPAPSTGRRRYVGVRFTANANAARSTTLVRIVR